ncbi:Rna/Rnp Complex-1-Interacting Phosphatase [Manis pentadactyla]|nr:Rna/Rnp Complex-1-Interacting Phosphatase [Manis pentadactyla]
MAPWGPDEPMASCPLRLGPESIFSGRPSGERKGGSHGPERWKDYITVGQWIPGTCFIAFKVPLEKTNLLASTVPMV